MALDLPGEIRQVMQGDHNVRISYWKAWRSRQIALDFAKGSSGASFNLIPDYLKQLVQANPGTKTALHTEFEDGVGQRFKYLFISIGACIEGYRYLRKVVIVDGSHLRGKYAGCLLSACRSRWKLPSLSISYCNRRWRERQGMGVVP